MGDAASTAFAVLVGVILLMALYASIILLIACVIGVFLLFGLALAVNAVIERLRACSGRRTTRTPAP